MFELHWCLLIYTISWLLRPNQDDVAHSVNKKFDIIELFMVGGSSAMQLSNQSDTPEVLYNLFLRIKTGVPL